MEGNLLNPLEIKENWKVKTAEDDIELSSFVLFRGVQQVSLYLKER
jgi:hypothetical protein